VTQNNTSAPERPHRWAVRRGDLFECQRRDHLPSFSLVVCWDCRLCMHCAPDRCSARRRQGFPEFPSAVEAEAS
jgi:hypothetical protein